MEKKKTPRSMESFMIANGGSGEYFYTDKEDKHITSLSVYYNRKVTTERLIATTTGGKEPKSKYITKVTLL